MMDSNWSHDKTKCKCEGNGDDEEESTPSISPKEHKSLLSFTSFGLGLRRGRSLNFTSKRSKKTKTTEDKPNKLSKWVTMNIKGKSKGGAAAPSAVPIASTSVAPHPQIALTASTSCCQCTCYRKTSEQNLLAEEPPLSQSHMGSASSLESIHNPPNDSDCHAEAIEAETHPEEHEDCKQTVENVEEDCGGNASDELQVEDVADVSQEPTEQPQEDEQHQQQQQQQLDAFNRGVYSSSSTGNIIITGPFMNLNWRRSVHEDCDEAARLQREREMERGVEPPANFRPLRRMQLLCANGDAEGVRRLQLVCPKDLTVNTLCAFLFQQRVTLRSCPLDAVAGCHTQVDFIHCLVPDLLNITNCSFYWGKMDRYEAERLLDARPEGTFLLRDSAQEEFLFSVSFRKYGRSLHARIEQWNHRFSFDSHDPGVFTSDTVVGLIEHYKDPSSCMFFEPMLTVPLHRTFVFSLQHLCRAEIISKLNYDDINLLQLPKSLKAFLKEYHYRQKVRVERFEDDLQWLDLRNVSV